MSPNNVIVVAHTSDKSFVFADCNADTQWNKDWAKGEIAKGDKPFKRRRGDALLLAHDMDNRLKTEYGVRELFLEERRTRRPKHAPASDATNMES